MLDGCNNMPSPSGGCQRANACLDKNGREGRAKKKESKSGDDSVPTLDTVTVKGVNPYKLGAAGLRAANSGRLMASGLAKFGVGAAVTPTGAGTVPGAVAMGLGTWNLTSSMQNFKSAGQLLGEAFTEDSSNYTTNDKFRAVLIGGLAPFGTLADDPGEPMYESAVREKIRTMADSQIEFLNEIGTMSP